MSSHVSLGLQHPRVLKTQLGKIPKVDWSSDGKYILSASEDDALLVWDAHTYNKLALFQVPSLWIMTCAFSPSAETIAAGGLNNNCKVISTERPDAEPVELMGHTGFISSCKYIDENRLLTSSGDKTCIAWDIRRQTPITKFEGHSGDVMALDFLPENPNLFISGGCDKTSKVWDLRTSSCCLTISDNKSDINSISFFPSKTAFATGVEDGSTKCFDIRAKAAIFEYPSQLSNPVTSVRFSNSGKFLFAATGNVCEVWDSAAATSVASLSGHENRVSSITLSPGGTALATGSWDSTIRLWFT
ncbi:heterotrimeric G protein beta subunit Git5 [Schizosaccharomyces cryophilus OY26]|uniref:Heterotrimeric G protein beta subunit Git5 n=1 Tax=Schizosaccharomyces cryophilus (strain OY26 / ATCC MYA-4695 / CBS 11777 / NBRC 106824 / NRRL Y48691) TaxID=653667 RepID=S9X606_SCHCR|nr:heterotrimeric G protein beta subunit Git5 [Schizosaccharomyces cryophilus OY26]EPY49226.1 heterotrimeric G protein beta subunit Git5 [Schizosaccharomyces cryophilus OY26]